MVNTSNGVNRYPGLMTGDSKGSSDLMVTFPPEENVSSTKLFH